MAGKKAAFVLALSLLISSFLISQSLVEAARKEKERRAKLKGKKSLVITNETLKKRKPEPALSVKTASFSERKPLAPTPIPQGRHLGSLLKQTAPEPTPEFFLDIRKLEQKVKDAEEAVAFLTIRMNALLGEFINRQGETSRNRLQAQIRETYLQLQKAQQEARKARDDLEKARRNQRK